MTMSGKEAIAGVRVLVCVAKADGLVHDEERKALAAALDGAPLPIGMTLEKLLAESIDLDVELGVLATSEAKDRVFKSACSMAYADGTCSPEEQAMLDHIEQSLGISRDEAGLVSSILAEARDSVLPTSTRHIADPAQRSKEIQDETFAYAVLSALLAGAPVAGLAIATDLAILAIQVKLARDVGRHHGHEVDPQAAKSLLGALGLGTGASIAVANLAKVVPGWSRSTAATAAFASTYALGKVLAGSFSSGTGLGGADTSRLRDELAAAEKEGTLAYHENRAAIDAKEELTRAALASLNAELLARKIDQPEYERRAAALA